MIVNRRADANYVNVYERRVLPMLKDQRRDCWTVGRSRPCNDDLLAEERSPPRRQDRPVGAASRDVTPERGRLAFGASRTPTLLRLSPGAAGSG